MNKALIAFGMLLMTAGASNAGGLVTKHSSSVQLTVDAARSTAVRIGSTYSTSGQGVVTDVGGSGTADLNVGSLTVSSGVGAFGGNVTATQATSGDAYSYSQSYTQGDAIVTSAPTTGEIAPYSNLTSYTAGTAGNLAGTIDNAHTMTLTAGGAGSSATGQFVSEITVID
tara:strand:- start:22 stop:531 length:510 start_codon:yes stop_codon:yes gene_type:complete